MLVKHTNENKLTPKYIPDFFMDLIRRLLEFFKR